jgi:hypothetical protein
VSTRDAEGTRRVGADKRRPSAFSAPPAGQCHLSGADGHTDRVGAVQRLQKGRRAARRAPLPPCHAVPRAAVSGASPGACLRLARGGPQATREAYRPPGRGAGGSVGTRRERQKRLRARPQRARERSVCAQGPCPNVTPIRTPPCGLHARPPCAGNVKPSGKGSVHPFFLIRQVFSFFI